MRDQADITLFDKLGFTPSRVIRVFGMRRSGNHAVINWMARNAPDPCVFINDCSTGKCPLKSANGLEINARHIPLGERDIADYTSELADGGVLILSYEDVMPDPYEPVHAMSPGVPDDVDTLDIVMFRGFMNWAASLLRKLQNNPSHSFVSRTRTMIGAMESYIEALELAQDPEGRVRAVSYDRWVSRVKYRSSILRALGFEEKDNRLGAVQRYGGGSSFQPDAKEAKTLSPLTRWHDMVNDAEFQLILLAASQYKELRSVMAEVIPQEEARLADYLNEARFPYHVQLAEDGQQ